MKIYIILLMVVLFNIYLETSNKEFVFLKYKIDSRKVSFIVCFTFILLLGLMRDESLGVDVHNYKSYFLGFYSEFDLKYFLVHFKYDLGYVILNKIVRLFTNNFKIFEIVVYVISFCIFSMIIYKESRYPALSFLIYIGIGFIGFNMCILRQAISCAICFLAFNCLEKKRKIGYIALLIIAISFHKTALFFLLSYFLSWNRKGRIAFPLKAILITLSFISSYIILPIIYKFYINDYSNRVVYGQGFKLLLFYSIVIIMMRFIINGNNHSRKEIVEYEGSFGAIYMQMCALNFALFTRITKYFAILFTLSVPNILYKSKYKNIYIIICSVMFSILYLYELYSNGTNIVPYKSIFNFL